MTDRLNIIFSQIPKCKVFADIGCDHGYIAKAMLDSGKCEKAIISDISAPCLKKAQGLLYKYLQEGKCESVLSDGFKNVGKCDVALIAGMGGEEIISIFLGAKFLPNTLVLQPMKNVDKVRQFVVNNGYKILSDYVFEAENKFYDLITIIRGNDSLTNEQIEFGKTNLIEKGEAFKERLKIQIETFKNLAKKEEIKKEDKEKFCMTAERLSKYV